MHKPSECTTGESGRFTKRQWIVGGACVLGVVIGGPAKAEASVKFDKPLAHAILKSESHWIRHNTGLRGRMTISCRKGCMIRAYSKRTGQLKFRLYVSVKRVADHDFLMYEDFSGWMKHDGETYYLDPPCQPASPCVDG